MNHRLRLADHIIFHELPFCGVLLDTRSFRVHRISQRAAGMLRGALHGHAAAGPYESLLATDGSTDDGEAVRRLLAALEAHGFIRPEDAQDA